MGRQLNYYTSKSILFFVIAALLFISCDKSTSVPEVEKRILTVFYTNDEHGWMEPFDDLAGGASGMIGRWIEDEGYDESENFLVLSGGDMWTGPAISSWFQGESMVEIMNAMGYDAAAIGNHDFDFTVTGLSENLKTMDFPLLSANIVDKSNGNIPPFAQPYIIKRSGNINVGIIGLSSVSTPYTAFPAYVEKYEFTDYGPAIDTYAPIVQDQGADIIIIIGHICEEEMIELVPVAKKYNVALIGGGHCHQIVTKEIDGIALVQAASYMAAYAQVELEYSPDTKKINIISNRFVINTSGYSDQSIEAIIANWRLEADEELTLKIGYCSETIDKSSVEMGNMVADSWFYTFSDADVSITNSGGIRQNITQGDIAVETIVGLLPFNNTLYELDLTGAELIDCVDNNYLIGGMTTINGYKLSDGTPVYSDSTYVVLTTDYLYSVTSNKMSTYDPEPYYTSVHYRQPLIDWMKSLNTSAQYPLNNYLDPAPRR
jgi:2',3'-cyclic-nucleotide 2'-phosphodiesterase (5'-nucleotidase family)